MAEPKGKGAPVYRVRSVDRVCDILDTLARSPEGASLTEIAGRVGIPTSSAFRYLSVLRARQYIERPTTSGRYQLGLAFRLNLARGVERLTMVANPLLGELKDEIEETINLGILDGAFVRYSAVAESPRRMRLAARVGERGYIHSTAMGKAICATLPPDQVRSMLDAAGLPSFSPATIVDPERYLTELERVRVQGYAVDAAENLPSGRCVAIAIERLDFPAALSVSAPAEQMLREDIGGIVIRLRRVAEDLSLRMKT